jgi:dTMP kinase
MLDVGCSALDVPNFSMKGLFITFEGTEGCGKSTQIKLLAEHLQAIGHRVRLLREPGGTPIGEEIRHTLKHSQANAAMTAEAELLLMNASRAQLVREIIRPALAAGEMVLSDRFYDSTTAYQGYGRQLDLEKVKTVIEFAVGETKPNLTLFLHVPAEVSAERLRSRQSTLPFVRDRIEEADRKFFERVAHGFGLIAAAEPQRVKLINGAQPVDVVCAGIWNLVQPVLPRIGRW